MSPEAKQKSRKAGALVIDPPPTPGPDPAGVPAGTPGLANRDAEDAEEKRGPEGADVALVPLGEIYAHSDDNHRRPEPDDEEKIQGLMRSFAAQGQQQSILVHRFAGGATKDGQTYELAFGYRRLEAARRIGWPTIRAEVRGAAAPEVLEEERAVENLHRQAVGPAGELVLVSKLLARYDGHRGRVAARLGVSEKWVADRLYLQRLDPRILNLVAAGHLPLGQAREIAKLGSADDQVSVTRQVLRDWQLFHKGHDAPGTNHRGERSVIDVEQTRELVGQASRSLKVVPWLLDKPFAGKGACLGCPDNTRSDPVLFEGSDDPDAAAGVCLNQACFMKKQAACEDAKAKVLAEARKIEKRVDSGGAPAGQIVRDAIARAAPGFVKPATVERFVKKQIEPPDTGSSAKNPGGVGGKSKAPTEAERRNQALRKYADALQEWQHQCDVAVSAAILKDAGHFICRALLCWCEGLADINYNVEPYGNYGKPAPTKPKEPEPLTPGQVHLLGLACNGSPKAQVQLANAAMTAQADLPGDEQPFTYVAAELHHLRPEAYARLAVGLNLDLKTPPLFEDFLPADLKPAPGGQTNHEGTIPARRDAKKDTKKNAPRKKVKAKALDVEFAEDAARDASEKTDDEE